MSLIPRKVSSSWYYRPYHFQRTSPSIVHFGKVCSGLVPCPQSLHVVFCCCPAVCKNESFMEWEWVLAGQHSLADATCHLRR